MPELRRWFLQFSRTDFTRHGLGPASKWCGIWRPVAVYGALMVLSVGPQAKAQSYTITDLGALGGSYSEAHGINNPGGVVGEWAAGAWVRAFYFYDGMNNNVPTLGGVYAIGYGINDSNIVTGESSLSGFSDIHAFTFQDGSTSDLGTLGGNYNGGYSCAYGINSLGEIVGESTVSQAQRNTTHAVLYNGKNKQDLGVLGGDYSSANSINDAGEIVGQSSVVWGSVTNIHAFLYSGDALQDLGPSSAAYSNARGINNAGLIVGEGEVVSGGVKNLHAFVWRDGQIVDLGTFGGSSSSAAAVNNLGQIVGYSYDPQEVSWAFLYDGSNTVNLFEHIPADSGWTNLTSADAINDLGQIAGSGLLANGDYHAYLLTPVGQQGTPVSLGPAKLLAEGSFQLTIQGTAGQGYVLEASTNLVDWVGISTNILLGSVTNYVDQTSTQYPARYFRAVPPP